MDSFILNGWVNVARFEVFERFYKNFITQEITKTCNLIKESIDRNTAALEALAQQVKINSYTLYAVEKSKSGTNGLYKDSYGKTDNPVAFVEYVNRHWAKPSSY